MAEGGIAAALSNVDDRDNWKVHFTDTMRGGNTSTTGAWQNFMRRKRRTGYASLRHGAHCLIARKDGRILQRNFGGHKYPRLAM
jgi:succinate dehydrogenase / fumarate reductase flavoprotein subunit